MGPLKGQLGFLGVSPFGLLGKGMELFFRPPGGSFEKDQGKWQGTEKSGGGGAGGGVGTETNTNKAREEIDAFCPRERGAGRLWAVTGEEDFTAPELSKLHALRLH